MRNQNRKKSRIKKKFAIFFIVFIILFIIFSLYSILVNPVLNASIEFEANKLATNSINLAIRDSIKTANIYDELISIKYNNEGNIALIQANGAKINRISEQIALKTEENIANNGLSGIKIPLGTLLGISLFTGVGPNVKIKVRPIGSVYCELSTRFENSGINQTIHRIYLNVQANLGVVVPFYQKQYQSSVQVLACENIIVGQVPEVYLYSDSLDTLLNFVPY